MTEQEAKKMLQEKLTCMTLEDLSCIEKGCDRDCDNCEHNYGQGTSGEQKEALSIAIKALEEIQQYKAIGTVEECREAVEKQTAKKPQKVLLGYGTGYECRECGTKIDWRKEE